jgi:hypothetical protein
VNGGRGGQPFRRRCGVQHFQGRRGVQERESQCGRAAVEGEGEGMREWASRASRVAWGVRATVGGERGMSDEV